MVKHSFYIGDFVVFGLTILVSIGIGIFYALSGGRQKTTSEYLVGGRSMKFLPVAISLLVSFESSIMMLGLPAEGYVYGIQYVMGSAGFFISQLLSVFIMVPLLHPLRITSAYEYLEYRFNSRAVRLLGTFLGMLGYIWYMGIVLFGPAVALEAVTGFPLWSSIFVISLVSVIYTSIGGIKAVIWTDVFQSVVMFAGMFSVIIKATIDVGGPAKVWKIAEAGGRLEFFNFDPDPTTRHTFWNLFVGSIIRGFGLVFNQSTVQRISSTKTVAQAKKVLLFVAPTFFVTLSIAVYEGIVAYSYYQTKRCDPFEAKQIEDPNQIVPFIVMDIFKNLPGMPGLFLASLFSASLSTLSSGLSSLSALLWADIVHPLVGDISEVKATIIAKVSVVVFGASSSAVAVLVSLIGGPLTQITGSLLAAFAGPLSGIFMLGCFFPRANAKGTLAGGFVSLIFSSWISMGQSFSKKKKVTPWLPPASTDFCPVEGAVSNMTTTWLTSNMTSQATVYGASSLAWVATTAQNVMTSSPVPEDGLEGIEKIYNLSYQWLGVVGIFTTLLVGMIVSFLTGMNKPGDVDPRYLIPISDILFICFPKSFKNKMASFGPQFMKEEYKKKFPDPAKKNYIADLEIVINNVLDEEELDDIQASDVTNVKVDDSAKNVEGSEEVGGTNGKVTSVSVQ
ncbi:sodium-coupled monocarboxylate transporter 1 [Aplysia californica]|uniref:Sodium-coupled monocarboxylate transporter 1 n=1 Tax=Aplysia californica TaxID=6500 RepID=A0ABM1VRS5_APLCA|nr:sodium-coupled monocarboxylate transporter 1 [Aplysia californica]